MTEPICESPSDSTITGCCADGRRCDEVCIAIIAGEECKQEIHGAVETSNVEDSRCQREVAGSCCNSNSTKLAASTTRDDASILRMNVDGGTDNACKSTSSCCHNKSLAKTAGTHCCRPATGAAVHVEQDRVAPKSDCCTSTTASVELQSPENVKGAGTCCGTEKCPPILPAAGSADISIIEEFQEACSAHLAEAMKKYKALLQAGICICRNAMPKVGTCCSKASRAAISRKRTNVPVTVEKSCCTSGGSPMKQCKVEDATCSKKKAPCAGENLSTKEVGVSSTVETLCSSNKNRFRSETVGRLPTAWDENRSRTTCQSSTKIDEAIGIADLENDAAREHVTFGISGMTCTGCVKKVMRVLNSVDGVENPSVNFVAGIGDMDVNTSKINAANALSRLAKETGFKCSRIYSDRQLLDLRMSSTAAHSFAADLPYGVESIEKVGKGVYRVRFNPLLVGARTVLARSRSRLAPPVNGMVASEGRRTLMMKAWSFLGATVLTIPVCILAFSDVRIPALTKGIIELVLATFVQLIAVPAFYVPALKALVFSRVIEMDMLVVISITAACGYSLVAFSLETAGITIEQKAFFETSTLLITLVLLGRLVANYAQLRAVQAVSLRSLQAETALLEDAKGEVSEIEARLLEFSDVVRVPAHSKIVSDGLVLNGESAVDESMLTGESLPVPKAVGDTVTAGTLNGIGMLRIRLTRLPGKNSITDIADLVQHALESKPRIQDLADVVAGYFVPVVVSISIIVLVSWIAISLRVRNQDAGSAVGTAITYAIAVLAISCSCALGLAVPLVLVISGGVAARGGVIIKQGDATERAFKATDIVFDKTGTLTTGELAVTQQIVHESALLIDQVLAVAYSLVKDDSHPVAKAVAAKLRSQDALQEVVEAVKSIPGRGVEASWNGQQVKAGNVHWLDLRTSASVTALEADDHTILCVIIDAQPVISFGLKTTLRPEAHAVVATLQARGLICHIVSGDQPTAVTNVASLLNIQTNHVASRQSPADKQRYIQNLESAGRRTIFVGDGTNDAVAIAAASIGVQIGAASDITRATADVVLLGGLEGIITLLEVSKHSFYRIMFNFVWSGIYNVFAILLASGALVKVRITPNYAGLGEIVSVLPVVLAALMMVKVKVGLRR